LTAKYNYWSQKQMNLHHIQFNEAYRKPVDPRTQNQASAWGKNVRGYKCPILVWKICQAEEDLSAKIVMVMELYTAWSSLWTLCSQDYPSARKRLAPSPWTPTILLDESFVIHRRSIESRIRQE
jgi:hypothetical protein